MIVFGIIAVSINSFFAPIAAILIIFGLVLLVLGVMGKPLMAQQIVYESVSPTPTYQAGPMKRCPRCGAMIPDFALICEKCGSSQ